MDTLSITNAMQEIIAITSNLPQENRPKFLKERFEETIEGLNQLIKYLESENIEIRLTLFSKGNESEFPYKVEQINGRLMVNL